MHSSFVFGVMRSGICHILFAAVISLLSMLSCNIMPELPIVRQPDFSDLKVESSHDFIKITVSLDYVTDIISECGFMLEEVGDSNTRKIHSTLEGTGFETSVDEFKYDTDYLVSAYVGNGRNLLSSSKLAFKTCSAPSLTISTTDETVLSSDCEFNVEVTSNVEYEVLVPEDVEWLRFTLDGSTCRFTADSNPDPVQRTCSVVFRNQKWGCQSTLTVVQESAQPHLSITPDSKTCPSSGGEFNVDVIANVEYEVLVPEDVEWLHFTLDGSTCRFTADSNPDPVQRTCSVVFRNQKWGCQSTLTVVQESAQPHLSITPDSKTCPSSGEEFNVDVIANVEYEVLVPEDDFGWLRFTLDGNICRFTVCPNPEPVQRTCSVVFRSQKWDCQCALIVVQEAAELKNWHELILPSDEIILDAYHYPSYVIEVPDNVGFELNIPDDVDWITQKSVEGSRKFYLEILRNLTLADRSCNIVFTSPGSSSQRILKVVQRPLKHINYETFNYKMNKVYLSWDRVPYYYVDADGRLTGQSCDWISFARDGGGVHLLLDENHTGKVRKQIVFVEFSTDDYIYVIEQSSCDNVFCSRCH